MVSARGEAARLVEGCGAGVAVAPEDPAALAAALGDLAADRQRLERLGAAGRRCAEERFGRAHAVERMAALLRSVV